MNAQLNEFQQSVLALAITGKTDKDIGDALGVPRAKVVAAMYKILRIYKVGNRSQLIYKIMLARIAKLKAA